MADILRGPILVGRRDPPPYQPDLDVLPSLLLTTLAVVGGGALPVGAQSFPLNAPQYPGTILSTDGSVEAAVSALPPGLQSFPELARPRFDVWDTTQASPRVLVAPPPVVAEIPVGKQQTASAPQWVAYIGDTPEGTPRALLVVVQAPLVQPPSLTAPEPERTLSDTSAGTPRTLRDVAPFVTKSSEQTLDIRARRIIDDTTLGTPKALYTDAVQPPGVQSTRTAPEPERNVVDTSQRAWAPFIPAVPPMPAGAQQTYTQPDRIRPVWDESIGTPKVLYVDAVFPPGVQSTRTAPEPERNVTDTSQRSWVFLIPALPPPPPGMQATNFAPDRIRPVWDESVGTPKPLFNDAIRPVGAMQTASAPERERDVVDTTNVSTPLFRAEVAPFVIPAHFPPQRPRWTLPDTSQSSRPQAAPFFNPPSIRPERTPYLPDDTSRGLLPTLQVLPPPFVNPPHFAPVWHWSQPIWDTGRGMPKPLFVDSVTASVGANALFIEGVPALVIRGVSVLLIEGNEERS